MEDKFSIPIADTSSETGELEVKMTEKIDVLDFASKSRRRLQRSLKTTESSTGEISIENKELKIVEAFLKLSSSIQVKLVPGTEVYLDKKTFTWELLNYGGEGMKL